MSQISRTKKNEKCSFLLSHFQHNNLQSRTVDKSRKENGSSVNYESAVSEIAIMTMMKLDRSMLFRTHAHVGQREIHFEASRVEEY